MDKFKATPRIYIAAENDPVLRPIVENGSLFRSQARLLKEALSLYPGIKWLIVAGSPCQDHTLAGTGNGILGLTGDVPSSTMSTWRFGELLRWQETM